MRVMAIDPGTTKSAFAVIDFETKEILNSGIVDNKCFTDQMNATYLAPESQGKMIVCIEMIASYGMAVSATVFETCVWIGRFIQHAETHFGTGTCSRMYRRDVKLNLCGQTKAKDANVRCAIIDRYEPIGGGKNPQVGTKKQPGPLFGVSKDIWAAIGVGLTYIDASEGKCELTPIKYA